jgi:hypothetical protein
LKIPEVRLIILKNINGVTYFPNNRSSVLSRAYRGIIKGTMTWFVDSGGGNSGNLIGEGVEYSWIGRGKVSNFSIYPLYINRLNKSVSQRIHS